MSDNAEKANEIGKWSHQSMKNACIQDALITLKVSFLNDATQYEWHGPNLPHFGLKLPGYKVGMAQDLTRLINPNWKSAPICTAKFRKRQWSAQQKPVIRITPLNVRQKHAPAQSKQKKKKKIQTSSTPNWQVLWTVKYNDWLHAPKDPKTRSSISNWLLHIQSCLKGLTQLWKSRRIYPKYMPKCSVGSTDHVCKFLLKKICVMWKILMFKIYAKKGLCYVICGSEVKTSDLAAQFHTILALQIRFCFLFKRSTNIQGWQN